MPRIAAMVLVSGKFEAEIPQATRFTSSLSVTAMKASASLAPASSSTEISVALPQMAMQSSFAMIWEHLSLSQSIMITDFFSSIR